MSSLVTFSLLRLAQGMVLFPLRLALGMVLFWLWTAYLSTFLPWSWPDIWSCASCRCMVVHSLPLAKPGWYLVTVVLLTLLSVTTPVHYPWCLSYELMLVSHRGTLQMCSALNITPTFYRSSILGCEYFLQLPTFPKYKTVIAQKLQIHTFCSKSASLTQCQPKVLFSGPH